MKNFLKLLFVITPIAIGVSMFIYSCQKEQLSIDKLVTTTVQSIKDEQLETKILSFINKVDIVRENPEIRSGDEPMDIDSAIWYIEAGANLTYGNASFEADEFVADSAFIVVPVINGQIILSDIQDAYDQVIETLTQHYANINANEKQLIVADVSLKESTDDAITLEVTSGFGTDGTSGIGIGNSYPWYWGWELGRCDGSGLGVGNDAADKIAQLANYTIAIPVGNSYYTDVDFKWVSYWDVPTNNNPYGEYLLFHDFQITTLNHDCLSTDEISYYKSALVSIGNMYKPSSEHSIIRYFLWDDTAFLLCDWEDCWDMAHFAKVKYAIWHINSNPPDDL